MRCESFARASRLAAATVLLPAAMSTAAGAQCDTTAGAPLQLAGHVVDARALTPIPAVAVVVIAGIDTVARLESDTAGHFSGNLCPRASYTAHFRRFGYRADSLSVTLDSARWAPLDVAMMPTGERPPTTLATTRVTAARVSAVEARVKRSGGIFVGPAEIERIKAVRASELLRNRRGIQLEDNEGTIQVIAARGLNLDLMPKSLTPMRAGQMPGGEAAVTIQLEEEKRRGKEGKDGISCKMGMALDGQMMPEGFTIDEVPAQTIIALEIYPNPLTIPVEFRTMRASTACGLVMIWTRTGKPLR